MAIKNLGRRRWEVSVTQRVSGAKPLSKQKTLNNASKLDAMKSELDLKLELKTIAETLAIVQPSNHTTIPTTFGDAVNLYKANCKTIWKPSYVKRLEEHLSHFPLITDVGEDDIWSGLQNFVTYMQEEATTPNGGSYRPATINRHVAIAKKIVSFIYKEMRLIKVNVLSGFPSLKENNIKYRILSNEERIRLFSTLSEDLKPIVYTAMRVPTRISELVNLKMKQIDFARMMIVLDDGTTKNGRGRWLPIYPELEPYILSLPRTQEFVFTQGNRGEKPLGYFSEITNRFEFNYYRHWRKACNDAGIQNYNFHKTRQQAAMQMLYEGFSEIETRSVGGWLSHAAFERYVRADDIMLQKKMGKWEIDNSWIKDLAPAPI